MDWAGWGWEGMIAHAQGQAHASNAYILILNACSFIRQEKKSSLRCLTSLSNMMFFDASSFFQSRESRARVVV